MTCYVGGGPCHEAVTFANYTCWKCASCCTFQVLPQPSPEELRSYYDVYHLSEQVGGVYDEVEDRMKADFPTKVRMVLNYTSLKTLACWMWVVAKGFLSKRAGFEYPSRGN